MFVRNASTSGYELATGAVAVAVCHRTVRVIVVRHGSHAALVPVISQVIITTGRILKAGINTSENMRLCSRSP